MSDYYIRLDGPNGDRHQATCDTVDEVRNEAVRYLGSYLSSHPKFAGEGHWRVQVEDMYGKPVLHVIVATITADQQEPHTI